MSISGASMEVVGELDPSFPNPFLHSRWRFVLACWPANSGFLWDTSRVILGILTHTLELTIRVCFREFLYQTLVFDFDLKRSYVRLFAAHEVTHRVQIPCYFGIRAQQPYLLWLWAPRPLLVTDLDSLRHVEGRRSGADGSADAGPVECWQALAAPCATSWNPSDHLQDASSHLIS